MQKKEFFRMFAGTYWDNNNLADDLSPLVKDLSCLNNIKARWTKPENIHMTCKFFGDITKGAII